MIDLPRPPLPLENAAGPVDNPHSAGLAVADQQIAGRSKVQGVLMRPLLAPLQGADDILRHIQKLPGVPLPDHLPGRSDFLHHIAVHLRRVVIGTETALHLGGQRGGQRRPEQNQGIAVGQALKVVMQVQIRAAIFPRHPAVPIQFNQGTGLAAAHFRFAGAGPGRGAAKEQMAVGQQVAVGNALRMLPAVADPALQVNQVGVITAAIGCQQGIAPIAVLGVGVNQSQGMMPRPAHKRASLAAAVSCGYCGVAVAVSGGQGKGWGAVWQGVYRETDSRRSDKRAAVCYNIGNRFRAANCRDESKGGRHQRLYENGRPAPGRAHHCRHCR